MGTDDSETVIKRDMAINFIISTKLEHLFGKLDIISKLSKNELQSTDSINLKLIHATNGSTVRQ